MAGTAASISVISSSAARGARVREPARRLGRRDRERTSPRAAARGWPGPASAARAAAWCRCGRGRSRRSAPRCARASTSGCVRIQSSTRSRFWRMRWISLRAKSRPSSVRRASLSSAREQLRERRAEPVVAEVVEAGRRARRRQHASPRRAAPGCALRRRGSGRARSGARPRARAAEGSSSFRSAAQEAALVAQLGAVHARAAVAELRVALLEARRARPFSFTARK